MAKIVIDSIAYDIPQLKIKAIKKIWQIVQQAQSASDAMEAIGHAVKIAAVGLLSGDGKPLDDNTIEDKVEWIESSMSGIEAKALRTAIREILVESGLLDENPGEAQGDAPATPISTETSTE